MSSPSAIRTVGVAIMAKAPKPGSTKTRLEPELGPEGAAALSAHMLADRCQQIAGLQGVSGTLALAPDDDAELDLELLAPGFTRLPQLEGGLGAGLEAAATAFHLQGLPALLVDSDSPTLPLAYLEEALAQLRSGDYDLVLGPTEDGGYYAIGLTKPAPFLFRNMQWSSSEVLAVTLQRAREKKLRIHLLPTWWDVDRPEDLDRLRSSLLQTWWPRRTAQWLRQRDLKQRNAHRQTTRSMQSDAQSDQWHMPWRAVSSRAVYATPWLSLREDLVQMPSGQLTPYSVVECGACVGVLPFVDAESVLLIRQYRYVAGRVTWEMPTGGVHAGETPEAAAKRELAEEARVRADSYVALGSYHTSKSVMDETAHLFLARGLSSAEASCDETEFIRAEKVPFQRALEMALSGEIVDSMTLIAILRAAR